MNFLGHFKEKNAHIPPYLVNNLKIRLSVTSFRFCHELSFLSSSVLKLSLECVWEAYFGVYNVLHKRFKTASKIRGFSEFASGEET